MKKLLWVSLMIAVGLSAHGQCKYWVNEIDEFKGVQKTFTEFETLKGGAQVKYEVSFGRVDTRYYVYLRKKVAKPQAMVVGYNDELIFKNASGNTITVKSLELTTGDIGTSQTVLLVKYQITREQLEQLNSSAIVKFRAYSSKGYWEEDVKERNAVEIHNALTCILAP